MQQRRIGPFSVSALGLGCMNLSHAYGTPPSPEVAEQVLLKALEAGIDFFDTAALYGFGANEKLVGRVLKPYRSTDRTGQQMRRKRRGWQARHRWPAGNLETDL